VADFPRGVQQSDELKKQNKELQAKYKIRGYPTVVLTDADGKEWGRTGYRPGGPDPFLKELEKLKASK
jgi:thioredoxin-related protein